MAIQVKKWQQNVGDPDVNKTLGSMFAYGCDRAVIVTTSGFTRQALDNPEHGKQLELWDGDKLRTEFRKNLTKINEIYRQYGGIPQWDRWPERGFGLKPPRTNPARAKNRRGERRQNHKANAGRPKPANNRRRPDNRRRQNHKANAGRPKPANNRRRPDNRRRQNHKANAGRPKPANNRRRPDNRRRQNHKANAGRPKPANNRRRPDNRRR